MVQPSPDAPSIPICHTADPYHFIGEIYYDYCWSGSGQAEFECDQVAESVVNLGALINYHTVLKNIMPVQNGYDDSIIPNTDPTIQGAISFQSGYTFQATQDISAGSELFGDYGEHWLNTRKGTYADHVPRAKDYLEAMHILENLILSESYFFTNHSEEQDLPQNQNDLPSHPSLTNVQIQVLADIIQYFKPRVANAFPSNQQLLEEFIDQYKHHHYNTSNHTDRLQVGSVILGNVLLQNHRTVPWLKEHGVCIENIRMGLSTIPNAGRGAFSNTFLPKGSLISPAPLLNVVDETKFRMSRKGQEEENEEEDDHDDKEQEEEEEDASDCSFRNPKQLRHQQQLLLNYCFSHLQSSIILCPQTNAILINHCSSRQEFGNGNTTTTISGPCNIRDGPNAYIRWATDWDENTNEWLNMTMEEIKEASSEGRRGLSLEVIALRDIHPNEEILMDYGEHWEQAWQEHVASIHLAGNNNRRTTEENEISIRSLINSKDFRTIQEQQTKPYPYYAQNVCIYPDAYDHNHDDEEDDDDDEYDDLEDKELEWKGNKYISKNMDQEYKVYPCEILERTVTKKRNPKLSRYHLGGFETVRTYTVRVFLGKEFQFKTVRLTEYPEASISFRVKPYQSPQLRVGAFRHFMEIPDDIFPDHWKDLMSCVS